MVKETLLEEVKAETPKRVGAGGVQCWRWGRKTGREIGWKSWSKESMSERELLKYHTSVLIQMCSGLNGGPPKRHVCIPEPVNVPLFGKGSLEN